MFLLYRPGRTVFSWRERDAGLDQSPDTQPSLLVALEKLHRVDGSARISKYLIDVFVEDHDGLADQYEELDAGLSGTGDKVVDEGQKSLCQDGLRALDQGLVHILQSYPHQLKTFNQLKRKMTRL